MKIFCVGIGGIGLSGVAQILRSRGHEVSGSDASISSLTASLEESGIKVFSHHAESNIDESYELLIYSEAVPESNPERMKAKKLGLKSMNYAKALGMISEGKKTIAITGTHGKTTVTGMLTSILLQAGTDPSIIIGSKMDQLGGRNYRVGDSDLFLSEACEYRDNFLELHPSIVLINNLEPDHLDYFGTEEKYYASFQKMSEKIPNSGAIILWENDMKRLDFSKISAKKVILSAEDSLRHEFTLQIPGIHNQLNACAAQAVARELRISDEDIRSGLEKFKGTWRRFEWKGAINGAMVYDDYGHHPTEIRATIQAAREKYPEKNLVVVFQPHQYSRTREFFDEFATSFSGASEVWITDIYKARDSQEDIENTSAEKLSEAISQSQVSSYIPQRILPETIQTRADSETVFLIMGAGNINEVFQHLLFDPQ
jgi:UDP-N-acetylmuramate--alanine ligase